MADSSVDASALEEIDEWLVETEGEATPSIVFDWLVWLPPIAQRRILLLGLAFLVALSSTAYAESRVAVPAHIDKIVELLLALAAFLSEVIEYQESHDVQDASPTEDDSDSSREHDGSPNT